jgi:hypothetical protein
MNPKYILPQFISTHTTYRRLDDFSGPYYLSVYRGAHSDANDRWSIENLNNMQNMKIYRQEHENMNDTKCT